MPTPRLLAPLDLLQSGMPLDWSPHPAIPALTKDEMLGMTPERILAYWERREEAIKLEKEDPYRHGFELETWKLADEQLKNHSEILLMGGNRAGKSFFAAKRVVQCLVENPGTIIWCLTETSANSIQFQQALVYNALPKELKSLGRGKVGYVMYSLRNGFTASKFTLNNGSQCIFRNWSQDISTIEGGEIGCPRPPVNGTHNIGFWADELIPMPWVETLRFRCVTRSHASEYDGVVRPATGIISFTAVDGWNSVVKSMLTGAKTVESAKADLLDGEEVPLVQQPLRKASSVVYFHTAANPFGGWSAMKTQLEGEKRETILCRAYGVPVRQSRAVFPSLSDKNFCQPEKLPDFTDANWVLSIDPAGAKPWVMVLFAIDPHGVAWAVKEFPDFDTWGGWIDPTKDKLSAGEAAQPNGYGLKDYADEIRRMESICGDNMVTRIIDPRLGAASYQKSEGSSNIIDDLSDEDIIVEPAEALDIETGIQAINNLLAWDRSEPMDLDNKPRLMFSDECQNLISCMQSYQPGGSLKAPEKDFVDCVRYFAVGNFEYFDEEEMVATGGGSY